MARGGTVNFAELEEFKKHLQSSLSDAEVDRFIEACSKELAARLLAKVIKRTPVGQYPSDSGKMGGTLRRGWTAGKNQNAKAFVDTLRVNHFGDTYVIEIINPVEYASYVEFGHRTRNHKGWVEGRFMLTISEQEIQQSSPGILEAKLKKWLGDKVK